ncbi:g8899 [Coccomyxa elongata]
MASKRQKTDSAGKKTPKNRDIGAMFKSASQQTPATRILLEERTVREAISAHAASDCDLLYRSHAEKVVNKRRDAKIEYQKSVAVPRKRTRRTSPADDDQMDTNLETLVNDSVPVDMSKGDADGLAYLDRLNMLVGSDSMPRMIDYHRLINIIRSHGLHGTSELALRAFCLLEKISSLHPAVEVQDRPSGPVVVTNTSAWAPIGLVDPESHASPSKLMEDAYDLEKSGTYLAESGLLPHLLTAMHQLTFASAENTTKQFDHKRAYGEVLLLKYVLGELLVDARARLRVFAAYAPSASRSSLLQNSQLWRLLKSDMNCPLKDMVTMLVELTGNRPGPDFDDMEGICAAGEAAAATSAGQGGLGKAECASMACLLLNLVLELFGTAEDASLFDCKSEVRSVPVGRFANCRAELDGLLLPLVTGSTTVLPSLPQKAAFLNALQPRDRLRLLGMVVAKKRVKRKDDAYAALDAALWQLDHAPCEAERFTDFAAADALRYLADEMARSEDLAQKVLCARDSAPSPDGLALLVSALLGAGAGLLPTGSERAEALNRLTGVADEVTSRLLERHKKGGTGALAQESLAALAAANTSLAVLEAA